MFITSLLDRDLIYECLSSKNILNKSKRMTGVNARPFCLIYQSRQVRLLSRRAQCEIGPCWGVTVLGVKEFGRCDKFTLEEISLSPIFSHLREKM